MSIYGRLNTGLRVNASISPVGDVDQYQTALIRGLTYTFSATGASTGNGTLADPEMSLTTLDGRSLAYNDDVGNGNRNAVITVTAGATATHLINVGEKGNNATGTYSFQISPGYASNYNDSVVGTGYGDAIAGMGGNDFLNGGAGSDYLYGQDGNDMLVGGLHMDYVDGGVGQDVVRGGAGADRLVGGAGADRLIGGTEADRFVFNSVSDSTLAAADVIAGGDGAVAFEGIGVAGGDVIDVSGIDANPYLAGNQAFTFSAVAGTATAALWNDAQGNTVLGLSTDSDAGYEFALKIADGGYIAEQYRATDFVL